MRTNLVISILLLCAVSATAAFVPMPLEEKARSADLIVEGTVVSVTQIMPNEPIDGFDGSEGSYMGARSIAVVRISSVWKAPVRTGLWPKDEKNKARMPEFIMVPCDYNFNESPSELTSGRNYVLFLREMGANIYHPIDRASTHVVHEKRVADFGMNHPPDKRLFKSQSKPLDDFRATVSALMKAQKTAREQPGTGQPATRPMVEPDSGDKPQPEAEGRSR